MSVIEQRAEYSFNRYLHMHFVLWVVGGIFSILPTAIVTNCERKNGGSTCKILHNFTGSPIQLPIQHSLYRNNAFTLCLASAAWARHFMWRTGWSETRVDRPSEHEGRRSRACLLAQTKTDIDLSINQSLYDASIDSHIVRPYHSVLVIDFNYNDWWVVSQLTGLPKQLHVIKH